MITLKKLLFLSLLGISPCFASELPAEATKEEKDVVKSIQEILEIVRAERIRAEQEWEKVLTKAAESKPKTLAEAIQAAGFQLRPVSPTLRPQEEGILDVIKRGTFKLRPAGERILAEAPVEEKKGKEAVLEAIRKGSFTLKKVGQA